MNTSKIVLGTVQFGSQYGINSAGRPSKGIVSEILLEAHKAGIRKLDTSSAYGDSEKILGECVPLGVDFDVVSKYPKGIGSIDEAIEGSLLRLNSAKLYGYLLHHFELYKENNALWNDFLRLKNEGKVQKIGFSLYNPDELELLLNNKVKFDILQIPYNIFDRKFDPYLKDLKEACVEINVRSTFLQGLFFMDRNALPTILEPLKRYLLQLDGIAAELGLTVAELALNHNLQNPHIDGVLIGVDNTSQLLQNITAVKDCEVNIEMKISADVQYLLNPVNWN